jgi:hypothetical protein
MAKMGRRRRDPEVVDNLYCTIDGWQRSFRFCVNHLPSLPGLIEKEGGIWEFDHLEVFGTVRHHYTTRKTRRRTGQKVVMSVYPGHFSRKDYAKNPEAVGSVRTEDGKLLGGLHVPSDVYYSLFPCLVAGTFKEMDVMVRNMRYRQGDLDGIDFSPVETPKEDFE